MMSGSNLLCAKRNNVYVLVEKPNNEKGLSTRYWSMHLAGLECEDLRQSADELRQSLPKPHGPTAKSKALLNSLANALGAKSYDYWLDVELPRIKSFLSEHGMTTPSDLISWRNRNQHATFSLTAVEVSQRLFTSGKPLPKRIFTGVGSHLYASGYSTWEFCNLWPDSVHSKDIVDFCMAGLTSVLRSDAPLGQGWNIKQEMTGRQWLIHALPGEVGSCFNLIGDNLVEPADGDPVITAYQMQKPAVDLYNCIFEQFRREIESSSLGWVDVIPLPGNDNIVFLRGANGEFDWVVRNQRDEPFTGNTLYPLLTRNELPSAMDEKIRWNAHIYYATDIWFEKLTHDAEARYYEQGGTVQCWPGYDILHQRELLAQGYIKPNPKTGKTLEGFFPHRLKNRTLMVSPLVTIKELFEYLDHSDWREIRNKRIQTVDGSIRSRDEIFSINEETSNDYPAAVSWLDAIAYCRHFEQRTGVPVRLMTTEEWFEVAPEPSVQDSYLGWPEKKLTEPGPHRRPDWSLTYGPDLKVTNSASGIPFLMERGFFEWLFEHEDHFARMACAATGKALRAEISRGLYPVHSTMAYKGVKVGFRLCYVLDEN